MIQKLLDFIFPTTCGFCNKIHKDSLCQRCNLELDKYRDEKIIDYTINKKKYFEYHINFLKYQGIIRNKIIDYKFNEKAYLYKTFSNIILKNKKICGILKKYDIIIPVPLSTNKKLLRGYNQTELIVKEISKNLNIKISKECLIKNNDVQTQSMLTKEERERNIIGAFKIKGANLVKDKMVILFDDIYTTGNTVNECCKILKINGVKEILVLTLAKD